MGAHPTFVKPIHPFLMTHPASCPVSLTPQELVKNSLRAVSEKHLRDLMTEPPESIECMDGGDGLPGFAPAAATPSRVPPIRVTISRDYSLLDGRQIQITVADEGGG